MGVRPLLSGTAKDMVASPSWSSGVVVSSKYGAKRLRGVGSKDKSGALYT